MKKLSLVLTLLGLLQSCSDVEILKKKPPVAVPTSNPKPGVNSNAQRCEVDGSNKTPKSLQPPPDSPCVGVTGNTKPTLAITEEYYLESHGMDRLLVLAEGGRVQMHCADQIDIYGTVIFKLEHEQDPALYSFEIAWDSILSECGKVDQSGILFKDSGILYFIDGVTFQKLND